VVLHRKADSRKCWSIFGDWLLHVHRMILQKRIAGHREQASLAAPLPSSQRHSEEDEQLWVVWKECSAPRYQLVRSLLAASAVLVEGSQSYCFRECLVSLDLSYACYETTRTVAGPLLLETLKRLYRQRLLLKAGKEALIDSATPCFQKSSSQLGLTPPLVAVLMATPSSQSPAQ
tara:strand:- start:516 stop:1040 length:525 start_codon:yes stop_codon:yes gene_type:complete